MTHYEFLASLIRSVRADGASATLAMVRETRPALRRGAYHDTLAVFYVWAVDRLVAGGLSDIGVLSHPLVHEHSPLCWWDAATLASASAAEAFVPSTLARVAEPQPVELLELAAA